MHWEAQIKNCEIGEAGSRQVAAQYTAFYLRGHNWSCTRSETEKEGARWRASRPLPAARTKMFNANEYNGILGETERNKIYDGFFGGIANLIGLTPANPSIIKSRKRSGTNRDY